VARACSANLNHFITCFDIPHQGQLGDNIAHAIAHARRSRRASPFHRKAHPALSSALLCQTDLHTRLVDFNVRLHHAQDLHPSDRVDALIGLKETLRDLCVVAGAWEPDMEQAHAADVAALRKLADPGLKAPRS
jgi:hypothetical protein